MFVDVSPPSAPALLLFHACLLQGLSVAPVLYRPGQWGDLTLEPIGPSTASGHLELKTAQRLSSKMCWRCQKPKLFHLGFSRLALESWDSVRKLRVSVPLAEWRNTV